MSAGKLFQRAGPSTGNALAPTVERRTGQMRRWLDDGEQRDDRLGTSYSQVNGPKYSGALPWRTQWTRTANLNWICSGMCNQCSDIRASVELPEFVLGMVSIKTAYSSLISTFPTSALHPTSIHWVQTSLKPSSIHHWHRRSTAKWGFPRSDWSWQCSYSTVGKCSQTWYRAW